jgi:hypothetical protein
MHPRTQPWHQSIRENSLGTRLDWMQWINSAAYWNVYTGLYALAVCKNDVSLWCVATTSRLFAILSYQDSRKASWQLWSRTTKKCDYALSPFSTRRIHRFARTVKSRNWSNFFAAIFFTDQSHCQDLFCASREQIRLVENGLKAHFKHTQNIHYSIL